MTVALDNAVECLTNAGIFASPDIAQHIDGYEQVMALGREFAVSERVKQAAAEVAGDTRKAKLKDFLVRYRDRQSWDVSDPMIQFGTDPWILDTVQQALGCKPRLFSADIWVNLPWDGKKAQWSQMWHRDPEDIRIVKVFLYVNDVSRNEGPFQFVIESHRRDWSLCRPNRYLEPDKYDQLPKDRAIEVYGKSGSLIMAQTSGLHCGGYCRRPRVLATWTYVSPGVDTRAYELTGDTEQLTDDQKYTLGLAKYTGDVWIR